MNKSEEKFEWMSVTEEKVDSKLKEGWIPLSTVSGYTQLKRPIKNQSNYDIN